MSDRVLTMLLHGLAGAGKTTQLCTGPKPLLLLDVEMASRFVKGRKIKWNPLEETAPVYDGTWDICVVSVTDFKKAQAAYEYLKSGRHPFKSVVVDSVSELQGKAVELIKGRQQFQTQDWGKLLSIMSFFCKDLRDIAAEDDTIEFVGVSATSKDYDGIIKPYLQGQIQSQAPYWFDITGYLYVQQVQDQTTGELTDTRNLLIGNHPNYEAKSRVPDLPTVLESPNIVALLDQIFGPDGTQPQAVAPPTVEAPSNPVVATAPAQGQPEPPAL